MCKYRKTSNKRRVSNKRRGLFVTNVLIDISIQLFTQLNSTQLLLLLLSHAGIPLNAGGVFADCSNKCRGHLLEVLRYRMNDSCFSENVERKQTKESKTWRSKIAHKFRQPGVDSVHVESTQPPPTPPPPRVFGVSLEKLVPSHNNEVCAYR